MLALRPGCECCDKDLPPDSTDARICSFECTFCVTCAEGVLRGVCPNCGGSLDLKAPDRTERVGCPYCGSLLDCDRGDLKLLHALDKPAFDLAIPIGTVMNRIFRARV